VLKEALKINSTDHNAFFYLGEIYKLQGDTDKARNCFQKVLDTRPNHPKASAELRLLNLRNDAKKSESTFSKLFKKK